MGRASKWFSVLLGLKKSGQQVQIPAEKSPKDKRRWSFGKSYRDKDHRNYHAHGGSASHRDHSTWPTQKVISVRSSESAARVDADKRNIDVAAGTAAVDDLAVTAGQAAAEVVRLTNLVSVKTGTFELWAAVKIQAAFRGCLARKALRALKGLVRLQALVRGQIERKRTSEWLLRMQALLRAQAQACAGQGQVSELSRSSTKSAIGPATPEKLEHDIRLKSVEFDDSSQLRKNCYRAVVDPAKAHRKNIFRSTRQPLWFDQHSHSFTISQYSYHQTPQFSSSCEIQSLTPLKFSNKAEDGAFWSAGTFPQFHSSGKRSPFTPTKSDGSSYLSGYSNYPNYMSFTESARAKIRSLSAPRQRPQYERSVSTKISAAQNNGHYKTQMVTLQANFTNKPYPGSGRLDRLGMPVGHRY